MSWLWVFTMLCMGASTLTTSGRFDYVVSIPDIHGDLEILLRALWIANSEISADVSTFQEFIATVGAELKSKKSKKSSARVLLINTGDIVDRGPQSLSCYKAIEAGASVLGWTLVNLIGNHEVMTIGGQADHYAHPNDIEEFGGIEGRHAQFGPGGILWKKITDDFMFLAKVEIGLNDATLFVHAGIDPLGWMKSMAGQGLSSVESINNFLLNELKKNPYSEFISGANSPVWTRDLALKEDKIVCDQLLPEIFEFFKINRIVVGHTPQESLRTKQRCGSKLLLADVAMSRWMGSGQFGNPSAIVFTLGNDGNDLKRIHNVYWNGTEKVHQEIDDKLEEENYEL